MNYVAAVTAFCAIGLVAPQIHAQQQDFSKVEIKTTDLGHKTYLLEGSGGNITVAIGQDAIIMVDGEFAPLHDKIKAAIAALSPLPVRYLVNTHFHGDHTGGNAPFTQDGVTVVAQENVKKRLAEGSTNGLTGGKTPPVAADALPKQVYATTLTLKVKGVTARLAHPTHAHTDGDTYVWFKDADVLATGDTVVIGRYPNVDFAMGGNIKGMIAATDIYL
jgi:cyclase